MPRTFGAFSIYTKIPVNYGCSNESAGILVSGAQYYFFIKTVKKEK